MRIPDITRQEFDCIVDALKGQLTKSQFKLAAELVQRLTLVPQRGTWVPLSRPSIRSSWPSGFVKPTKKTNSFHHKPRDKKPPTPKTAPKVLSADEILAGL